MPREQAIAQPEDFAVQIVNPYTPENLARMSRERGENLESSHRTDAYARSLGYRAATVGGNIIKGYVLMGILKAWGLDWLQRGSYYLRYRHPLYGGDDVQVSYSPALAEGDGVTLEWQAVNADGTVCASGWACLPNTSPEAPFLADFPFTPPLETLLHAEDGEKLIGQRLPSYEAVTPDSVVAKVRSGRFSESEGRIQDPLYEDVLLTPHVALGSTYPELREHGLLAPWTINAAGPQMSKSWFEGNDGSRRVAADIQEQFFSIASVEESLTVHHRISDVFERKGSRFVATEMLIVANGDRPVLLRTSKSVTLGPRTAQKA